MALEDGTRRRDLATLQEDGRNETFSIRISVRLEIVC